PGRIGRLRQIARQFPYTPAFLYRPDRSGYSIPTRAGDLVLFDFRIDHRATMPAKRHLKALRRKLAIFMACSAANAHAESYKRYIFTRPDYEYLKARAYPPELVQLAEQNNVVLG